MRCERKLRQCQIQITSVPWTSSGVLDPEFLESLKKEDCLECLICREKIASGQSVGRLSPCGHIYETKCIALWLERSSACPMCRQRVSRIELYPAGQDHCGMFSPEVELEELLDRIKQGIGTPPSGWVVSVDSSHARYQAAKEEMEDEMAADAASFSQCGTCGMRDDADMVACDFCDRWFHYCCVRMDSSAVPAENWFCDPCWEKDGHKKMAERLPEERRSEWIRARVQDREAYEAARDSYDYRVIAANSAFVEFEALESEGLDEGSEVLGEVPEFDPSEDIECSSEREEPSVEDEASSALEDFMDDSPVSTKYEPRAKRRLRAAALSDDDSPILKKKSRPRLRAKRRLRFVESSSDEGDTELLKLFSSDDNTTPTMPNTNAALWDETVGQRRRKDNNSRPGSRSGSGVAEVNASWHTDRTRPSIVEFARAQTRLSRGDTMRRFEYGNDKLKFNRPHRGRR